MIAGILMAGTALVGLGTIGSLAGFYVFYLFNAVGYSLRRSAAESVCCLRVGSWPARAWPRDGLRLSRHRAGWCAGARGDRCGQSPPAAGMIALAIPRRRHRGYRAASRAVREAERPPESKQQRQTKTSDATNRPTTSWRQPAFYLLMFGSMCSIAAVGGANQHLKLYLSIDHSYSQQAAAEIASLTLGASLVGRLLMGWLADRWPKKRVMLLIYLLVAVALPIPLLATTHGAIVFYAILFGIGLGGEYMVIPLMAAELFGVRVLGRAMGLILAADGVAEAVAPVAVGRLHDVSGNYVTGFSLLIGFAIAGAIAIALLPSRGKRVRSCAGARAGLIQRPGHFASGECGMIRLHSELTFEEQHGNETDRRHHEWRHWANGHEPTPHSLHRRDSRAGRGDASRRQRRHARSGAGRTQ